MSLLTSYAFGLALFLAVQHRQRRWNAARSGAQLRQGMADEDLAASRG